MNRKKILIATFILGILGCGGLTGLGILRLVNNPAIKGAFQQAGHEFTAMFELQQKVSQTYSCESTSVQLMNGNRLNISLVNSAFNDLSPAQQATKAQEIARFVRSNYTGNARLIRIVIVFVQSRKVGFLNTNWSASYPFEVEQLDGLISTQG